MISKMPTLFPSLWRSGDASSGTKGFRGLREIERSMYILDWSRVMAVASALVFSGARGSTGWQSLKCMSHLLWR